MIYCIIDGDKVFPNLSQNIKITRENPDVKDKGSYTLDVVFPMSIYENQVKFEHMSRMDVSLKRNRFNSVTLYVDRTAIISGVGIVTSVTNEEVKLQIMDANSEVKYVVGFDKVYIDDIMSFWNKPLMFSKPLLGNPPTVNVSIFMEPAINYNEATWDHFYVGDIKSAVYTPVYDEQKDVICNEIVVRSDDGAILMLNPEAQPNLLYVIKSVLAAKGYECDLSEIDKEPWNRIFIVNTGCFLPHWTLEKFISEVKKFFGLSVRFSSGSAKFTKIDFDAEAVTYDCIDEFSTEYDEDGLKSADTSNLKYNLYDSPMKTFYTEISDDVMNAFTVKEFESEEALNEAFSTMTVQEKASQIFVTPTGYFYAHLDTENLENSTYELKRCGHFNKLVRDETIQNTEELAIAPVTMANLDYKFRKVRPGGENWWFYTGWKTEKEETIKLIMPTTEGEETPNYEGTTVQEALDGVETSSNEREESERMEVFFLSSYTREVGVFEKWFPVSVVGTDPRLDDKFRSHFSFALDKVPEGITHIGQLHVKDSNIDAKNQRCIRFFSDDIPDPTRIYNFRNKRYLCEKIEIQITERGIDPLKTGYFYEIL